MIWWVCDIALDDFLEATGEIAADNPRPHQWLEQVTPSKAFCEFINSFSVRQAVKIGLFTGVVRRLCLPPHTPKAVTYHEPTVMVHTPKAVAYHEPTLM